MRSFYCAVFTTLTLVIGCGGGGEKPIGRKAVSGTVSLDGAPLNRGAIDFRPDGSGAHVVGGGAVIKDGKFSIPANQGLVPGKYKVSISSPDSEGSTPAAAKSAEDQMNAVASAKIKERVAAKYNTATELTEEVKSSGSNEFQFKVESDKN